VSYENDKILGLVAIGVKEEFQDLRIILVLNSLFKEQIEKDSLYKGIEVSLPYQINDYVMGSSLQN
jgi:hypothetical protein